MIDQRFASLAEAAAALRSLRSARVIEVRSGPTLHQLLVHCAQSIEYSRSGYPELKPPWLRKTVGRLVLHLFMALGFMRHDLAAPVPGAPAIAPEGDSQAAWDRLLAAIDGFQRHEGPLFPHLLYGDLDKATYDRVQALHIANHLSTISTGPE